MNTIRFLLRSTVFLLVALLCASVFAQVKVSGYYRKNGTYVKPHYRSSPDSNFYNNWSTKGNVNPYTGKPGTRRVTSTNEPRTTDAPLIDLRVDPVVEPLIAVDPPVANPIIAAAPPIAAPAFANIPANANLGIPDKADVVQPIAPPRQVGRAPALANAVLNQDPLASSLSSVPPTEYELLLRRMQKKREEIQARRQATRAAIPVKVYTDEERAASKYKMAHMHYLAGRADHSKQWLEKVIQDYPATYSATLARLVITKF